MATTMSGCARLTAVALAAIVASCATIAPSDHPMCADDSFHAFDFWLGDWDVEQRILRADGNWLTMPARTSVHASPDGCTIAEHWSGEVQFFWESMDSPESIWGFSVRHFDPEQGTWSIYWMDSRHPDFEAPYVGNFDGDRGEFYRRVETSAGARTMRITFTRQGERHVDWELAVSPDDGATWRPLWLMAMARR